jgi:hypothetical protein
LAGSPNDERCRRRHRVAHAVPHILIEAAQDIGGAHDLRDLSAQALEQRSEFNRDMPAADHEKPARKLG